MFGGNPNVSIQPYEPVQFGQSPLARGQQNPFRFGVQRTQGQLAFQPNRYGFGRGTNTTPQVAMLDRIRRLSGY